MFDLAFAVQARLEVVVVELDAERLQIRILLGAQVSDGELPDRFKIVCIVLLRDKIPRNVLDVFAVVAFLRPARLAGPDSPGARLHGKRELVDLGAGIVVVELARDRVSLGFEQRRDRIAERALPAVADVQRPGRVRRHEFHLDLLALGELLTAIVPALPQDFFDSLKLRRRLELDVEKSCACDGRRLSGNSASEQRWRRRIPELLSDLAGVTAELPAELHRPVGRKIPVFGILRPLYEYFEESVGRSDFAHRLLENLPEGFLGIGHEMGANYSPGSVELDRIDVQMPADVARRVDEKPLGDRCKILLARRPRRGLHQELAAVVLRASRG